MKDYTKLVIFVIALVIFILLIFFGMQCKSCEQSISHLKSGTVGLNRKVTLYSADGKILREWRGKYVIEDAGASIRFMHEGRAITVSGTYVVEERPLEEPKK